MKHRLDVRRRAATGWVLREALRLRHGNEPVRASKVIKRGRLIGGPNPTWEMSQAPASGRRLEHPKLAEAFGRTELGLWTLHPDAINYLAHTIRRRDVRVALETGSGVSTVCIAQFLKDLPATTAPRHLYSFEQDVEYATQTRQLLDDLSLSDFATVIHAPLSTTTIDGLELETYSQAPPISHGLAQLLLIDGPRGPEGARFAPLLALRPFMSRDAIFFLDDAFRGSEIETSGRWEALPWVVLDGIVLVGHGLLQGRIAG